MSHDARNLSKSEIDILIRLLRYGGPGCTPITLPSAAREKCAGLWRLELVHLWYRQSPHGTRQDAPFYSLTVIGRQRAISLMATRKERNIGASLTAADLERRSPAYPPPPHLNQENDNARS